MKSVPIDFYDFFSGCGGTSCAMRQAGMSIRLGMDIDVDAEKTYRRNFPEAEFLCRDIRSLEVAGVSGLIQRRPGVARLFGACAPCQPFSKQNQRKGRDDGRRNLLGEFSRFIKDNGPDKNQAAMAP